MNELFADNQKCPESVGSSLRPSSITEQLVQRKQRLEAQLAQVNDAISCLQANPEIAKAMHLVSIAMH